MPGVDTLPQVALRYQDEARSPALLSLGEFEDLYRLHGRRLKSVARNLLGNTTDAEDAVQEAFLKLLKGLPGFRGEASLSTWLYRILVNACHDMARKRRRRPEAGQDALLDPEAPPADPSLRLLLERALLELPMAQRDVFVLFAVEGFTHREVGEILGIPEGTSKHFLFEAKRHLQRQVLAAGWRPES